MYATNSRGIGLPVEGNRHSTQPRAQNGANQASIDFVHGQQEGDSFSPCIATNSMDVYERQRAQHGDVCASQEGVQVVCRHRSTKQNENGGEEGRRCQSCEEERQESGLCVMC